MGCSPAVKLGRRSALAMLLEQTEGGMGSEP